MKARRAFDHHLFPGGGESKRCKAESVHVALRVVEKGRGVTAQVAGLITRVKPRSYCTDDPLQWCRQAKKFFSFAVMMLNISSEPAQQNTVCFTLTTPMAFTGSS